MIRRFSLLILLLAVPIIRAQESQYEQIKQLYENFEYDKVIQSSESIIADQQIGDSTKIDIYLMRAVSFYVKKNIDQVKNSFEKILLIRKDFSPNGAQYLNSALINIFNGIKEEHLKRYKDIEAKRDSAANLTQLIYSKQNAYRSLMIKNFLFPGWGQVSMGQTRGVIYSAASLINLSALIYYIVDTNQKQNDYERETQNSRFDLLYSDYNKSYRTRNFLWVSYATIWVLSQLDFWFLDHSETQTISIGLSNPSVGTGSMSQVDLSLRFPIHF